MDSAFALYRQGRYSEAAELAETCLALPPRAAAEEAARFLLGDSYYSRFYESPGVYGQLALNSYEKALQKFPDSILVPKARHRMAEIYGRQKDYAKAAYLLRKNLQHHPGSAYAARSAFLLGETLLQEGRETEGLDALKSAAEAYPGSMARMEALLSLAEYYFDKGDHNAAMDYCGRITSFDTVIGRTDLRERVPGLLVKLGKQTEARRLLFKLLNLLPEDPLASRWSAVIGDSFNGEGKKQEALKIYYETKKRYPRSEGALLASAGILDIRAGQPDRMSFEEASSRYNDLLADTSDAMVKSALLMRKAAMLKRLGHEAEAVAPIRELLEKFPHSPARQGAEALYRQVLTKEVQRLFEAEQHSRVVALVQRSYAHLSEERLDIETERMIAESHFQVSFFSTAARLIERLMKNDGDLKKDDRLVCRLGECYFELGQTARADDIMQRFLQQFPKSRLRGEALAMIGEARLKAGDHDGAQENFELSLKEQPWEKVGEVYYFLGSVHWLQGRQTSALDAYRNSLAAGKNDKRGAPAGSWEEEVRFGIGELLYELGRNLEALGAYASAVACFPQSPRADWARYRMALIHDQKGEYERSIKMLQEVRSKGDDSLLQKLVKNAEEEMAWRQVFSEYY
jgi:TolA-binding protein